MPNNLPNLYSPNLSGIDPSSARIIRDLVERMNYLTTELDRVRGLTMSASPGVDAAKKESPQPGIITVPATGGDGQSGLIRVNSDGVIVSYVNPTEGLFPYVDVSVVGNVGAGLDVLHTFSLPAGSLATDGDILKIVYGGTFAATANTKRLRVEFDSHSPYESGGFDIRGGNWRITVDVIRISSTSARFSVGILEGQVTVAGPSTSVGAELGAILTSRSNTATVANLNSNAVTIRVLGESGGSATDDVVQNLSVIEFYRPRTKKFV